MDADLLKGFYLEDLLVEPAKGRVTSPDVSEHLSSRASEILLYLASHPGDVLSRDALLSHVWGDGKGSEEALTHAVSELRHALHDRADDPRFIQTLPRRGYRLLVRPTPANGDTGTIVIGATDGGTAETLGLFDNLNRRGVLETAVAYLILGWLLIQVADIVFAQLLLPQWVGTFVTVLVIAGFPIALLLSWFLEFRDGRAILDPMSPEDARRRRFGRTYMSVIGALAIAAVGVFVFDQSIGLPENTDDGEIVSTTLPPVLDNSIAVLPFLNLDGMDETKVFANGLADDVISELSRVPGLLVSSRGDSFTLEPNSPSNRVRQRLRVAMYLGGSVQSRGDELRVTVQLVDSETGFQVHSRTFDRPRDDFFEIRDEITALTVANVRVALPQDKQLPSLMQDEPPTLDAYLLYRRGIDTARAALSMQSINQALDWFERALEVDPEYAAAHAGKCVAYVNGFSEIHEISMIDNAQNSCATALQLNPNLDIVHTALGNLYLSMGRLEDAERSFLRALEIDPSSSESYMGLGEVFSGRNNPEQAEDSFRQAIGLRPGDWAPYNRLGNFLYYQGRYVEAAEQYQYAAALDRSNSNVYSNLGAAYMLAGDFAAALPTFERSLEISPKATAYTNLGMLHYYLGQFEESIANHQRAVELEPNDPLSRSNLGDALWNSGAREDAREVYATALQLAEQAFGVNSNDPFTMMDMAWIQAMLGNDGEARSLMGRARALAPDDPYTHYYDGLVLAREGNVDDAIAALAVAVELGYPVAFLSAEPHLEALRSHEGFAEILAEN
jgi:tetratricopeptide (TPR) repeat protein/TolB-like protein/DNA-binding winged helix-turn-helix (wHTH) protein